MANRPTNRLPCRLPTYIRVHNAVIGQFRAFGFVGSDTLSIKAVGRDLIFQGEVACAGLIVLQVKKLLEYVSPSVSDEVQSFQYSYNVSARNRHNIFRYDNLHPDFLYPGHPDEYHRHDFDWMTGDELPGSPSWIGTAKWPLFGDVLWEIHDWHVRHSHELNNPDEFAQDLQSELRD